MVLEIPRRKFFRTINSKYIYGRVVSLSRQVLSLGIGGVCQPWWIPKTEILVLIHFSRQPLVHTVIFFIEMAILGRLAAKFNSYYADRPGTIYMPWKMM
jgi:protein Mpv17